MVGRVGHSVAHVRSDCVRACAHVDDVSSASEHAHANQKNRKSPHFISLHIFVRVRAYTFVCCANKEGAYFFLRVHEQTNCAYLSKRSRVRDRVLNGRKRLQAQPSSDLELWVI